ncbi:hypothetical protein [Pseudomonas protegens]|uniref:hypothetical protein n=1 Tax=Pseudomonas protegens TaxID=380021 RepID=UPI0027625DA9|nr:hypothetical protein [Pseudomonas protegens]MDP9514752.1 hypothetical protein [Pseudomonas protegens]
MNKNMLVGLLVGVGMLGSALSASAADNLFKSYAYGSPMSSYTKAKGYYDCSEILGGTAKCLDGVEFLGKEFTAGLVFSNSKLIMVSLMSEYDQSLFATAIGSIGKTFRLTSISDSKSHLDVVELAAKASSRDEFASRLSNYEAAALAGGNVTYTLLEGVGKKNTNTTSLLAASPDNTRAAEIMLVSEEGDTGLIIRFSYPKFESNKISEAAKKPVESF